MAEQLRHHQLRQYILGIAVFFITLFLLPYQLESAWLAQAAFAPAASYLASPKTIQFSNYTWTVRSGTGGPGPNTWRDTNVWVDSMGFLHLKLTYDGTTWSCAEVTTLERLGFGAYQFQVIGPIDRFDPNLVLGLFNYPPPDVGPDGTNEIDIEIARWGAAANPNGNYTVWPAQPGKPPASKSFEFSLNGDYTTQRFHWTPQTITFQSLHGHTNGDAGQYAHWTYQPETAAQSIPQDPLPVHLNLWLFQGNAPTDGQEVEIIITQFTFIPLKRLYLPVILK